MTLAAEDDARLWAELRQEFQARIRRSLAEVDRELAALAAGGQGEGYARIETLMHREAGAGAVFGFDDVSTGARAVELLVQQLGGDTSAAALERVALAIQPLREVADTR